MIEFWSELEEISPSSAAIRLFLGARRTGARARRAERDKRLAAIRTLFGWLVTGQVVPAGAAAVAPWIVAGGDVGGEGGTDLRPPPPQNKSPAM
jgi:hypothetical protein